MAILKKMLPIIIAMIMSIMARNIIIAADPDPLQDICVADLDSKIKVNGYPCKEEYTADDLSSSILANPGDTNNIYGRAVTEGNVENFPGINTQGISVNRVDFAPGGMNPPHVHPRASEIQTIVKGELYMGLITTSNRFISKTLKEGESFVFPRGLIHFQKNVGKEPAVALVSFNSENPGVMFVAAGLFNSTPSIPDELLGQAFQLDSEDVRKAKARLFMGSKQCSI